MTEGFTSLSAFRQAHVDLLQRYRANPTAALLDEIETVVAQGSALGALLDADQERWEAQGVLDYWVAVLYRARRTPAQGTLAPFDSSLAPELPDDRCPFRGLAAFQEAQKNLFFGRSRVIADMVSRLQAQRLLAVIGSSGSGKSSLVLAGLVPALKAGRIPSAPGQPASDAWRYIGPIVPGAHPIHALATALAADAPAARELEAAFLADAEHLTRVLAGAGVPALLLVDQFEEIFTLCGDDRERRAFAGSLLAAAHSPGLPHRVVVTMRSDFDAHVAALPGLQAAFEQAQFRVPPFNAAELREAIERPAEQVGLKFEAGIVDRLVNEILGEPAGLPLLQFTLHKLWQHRDRNRVTVEAYRKVGGPLKALERSADELFERLLPEEQVTARRILLRIVRPGASLEVTSHRVLRESMHGQEPRDRVDRVLDKLIAAGLLRQTGTGAGDTQVEVAHEALLRNWPRLVDWLDEERIRLRQRFSLTAAAQQWVAHGRDPGGLLGGSLLAEAQGYTDLDATEREFVTSSARAVERAARLRERAFRIVVTLLILVALFAMALGVFATRLQRALTAEREQRNSLQLALGEADRQKTELETTRTRLREAESAVARLDATRAEREVKDSGPAPMPPPDDRPEAVPKPPLVTGAPVPSPVAPTARMSLANRVTIRASSTETGRVLDNTTLPLYEFRIWIEGPASALQGIKSVQYEFDHPTFRQKVQRSDDRGSGFASGYVGWGCLSSVKVTLFPVDDSSLIVRDFDMCAAVSFRYKK